MWRGNEVVLREHHPIPMWSYGSLAAGLLSFLEAQLCRWCSAPLPVHALKLVLISPTSEGWQADSTPWCINSAANGAWTQDSRIPSHHPNHWANTRLHPIPIIDEVLQELGTSEVFSKLALMWGYHQLELHVESGNVTFVTHCGLCRWKSLLFGTNAAPEIYQHEIHKVIQGILGTANISDDIIVHGATQRNMTKGWSWCLENYNELVWLWMSTSASLGFQSWCSWVTSWQVKASTLLKTKWKQ